MQAPSSLFQNQPIRMFSEEIKPEEGDEIAEKKPEFEDLHKYANLG